MRKLFTFIVCLCLLQPAAAKKFLRDLPSKEMRKVLTPENCKNMDAVIVLKEQSYTIQRTEYEYHGVTFVGPSITTTKVLIVKLFNDAAVKRYGDFEFKYVEFFEDIPHTFEANVRVLKPDGKTNEMSSKEVQTKVVKETSDGTPLVRAAFFKVPDLAIGDILQIEYSFQQRFSRSSSEIFYYNDRDFVMFSNLYVTLPAAAKAQYLSFPANQVGEPEVKQASKNFGAGKTYFWSAHNLQGIPDEPYSYSFESQSLMTAFIVERWQINGEDIGDWESIAENFYEDYLDKDKIKDDQIEELGFVNVTKDSINDFDMVDRLYTALRTKFTLDKYTSLYPASTDIKNVFKKGKGDASDLAYIMFKILEKWEQKASIVWLRDQRDGNFEKSVPTLDWFDRLGVLVTMNEKEKLYDFDRCIPNTFDTPWFLKPVEIVVVDKKGSYQQKINRPTRMAENIHLEKHVLKFDENLKLIDQMEISLKGEPADKYRDQFYGLEPEDIREKLNRKVTAHCFASVDTTVLNDFWNEPVMQVTMNGPSCATVEQVENFITFRLNSQCCRNFRDAIFAPHRKTHINLRTPFQMDTEWQIEIPAGYRLKSEFTNKRFYGPNRSGSQLKFTANGNRLDISARLTFPEAVMHRNMFQNLINLLEKTLNEINHDIVLEKI